MTDLDQSFAGDVTSVLETRAKRAAVNNVTIVKRGRQRKQDDWRREPARAELSGWPYRFINREFMVITYESDPEATANSPEPPSRRSSLGN